MRVLVLGTIVIASLAVSALVDSESGLAIWRELRLDLAGSGERIERLIAENEALRSELAALEQDPGAIDRAIREELDLALPGEVVFRFVVPRDDGGARREAPFMPSEPTP